MTPTLVVVSGPPGSGKTTLAHKLAAAVGCPVISRREQDDPLRRVHAAAPGDAAGRDAAHRAFRRVSIDAPALEVDTSDGYRPPFGQILSFAAGRES